MAGYHATDMRTFNVFNYITLRAVLAAMTALFFGFIVGPAMIRKLTAMKIGQSVRTDGPQTHLVKAGTPTMGGALILASVAMTTLLWGDLHNHYIWVVLFTTLGVGAIGWVDDYRKVVHRNPKGLSARAKMFWQSLIALAVGVYLWQHASTCRAHRTDRAVLQDGGDSAGRDRLHRADLSGDRRQQQCGEPDRRSGRAGDHADGAW